MLPKIKARLANDDDCEEILIWRNDPLTRKSFFNSDLVKKSEHSKWFANVQESNNSLIVILTLSQERIGMVRYDSAVKSTLVSINTNPMKRGMGNSSQILVQSEVFLKNNIYFFPLLVANILKDNELSIKVFKRAGYQLESENNNYYKYIKKLK